MVKRRSLFSKILSGTLLIIFGTVLILLSSIYVQSKLEEQTEAKDIQLGLMDAQRRLSNFQLQRSTDEISSANDIRQYVMGAINELENGNGLDTMRAKASEFFDSFDRLIELRIQRGVNEESGLEGVFRKEIHSVQDKVAALGLQSAEMMLLEIRRREKDFIMRKDLRYVDSVKHMTEKLIDALSKSPNVKNEEKEQLLNSLRLYQEGFVEMSLASLKIKELHEKLNITLAELQVLGEALAADKSAKAEFAQGIIYSLMGAVLIVSVLLSLWLSKRISTPITQLKEAANEMAKGNLDISVGENHTHDEVYELSRSFGDMVKQIKQRTDELMTSNKQLIELNKEIRAQQEVLKEQSFEIENNNKRLSEQNKTLEELIAEKNVFLGIVSHDLKNPLHSIKLAAQLLYNEKSLSKDEISEFSNDILISSAKMFELIKNLLDANAVEQGKVQVSWGTFDAAAITNSVVESYRHKAEQKNIRIELIDSNVPVYLYGDSGLYIQILDNLVSNAVKYSPFNTLVKVELAYDSFSGIGKIKVIDEGPGLSKEDQSKLFGKYAKLTPQPTGGEHSTGLGLSIVKKLAEMMHGRVLCESELGEGSTFILEMPLSEDYVLN